MSLRLQPTKDIQLKTFEIQEAPLLFGLTDKNRSYLREWLPWLDNTNTAQDSEGFIQFTLKELAEESGIVFGVWNKEQLVGVCSFQKLSKGNRSGSIGYWISQDQAGQGVARTATQALIKYGLTELNLHRIEIRCATENYASQKVAEACGLQLEGVSQDAEWLYDHFVNHKVYAIINK